MNYLVLIGDDPSPVNLTNVALVEGMEIARRSDEAISTARVTFQQRLNPGDKFAEQAIPEWSHIRIVEDTVARFPRFGGYIAEITREANDNEKYRADCRCVDYGILFERKISALHFTDTTDKDIAIALSTEGGISAPSANVDFTNVLAEFDARDLTIREALERLCEITGCRWHVDTAKAFRYHKPGLHFAPVNLSDTPDYLLSYPYQMLQCNREFSSAANRMLFLGGPDGSGEELRVTREDTASQATYGVIEAVKVDRSISAAPVAQIMLDAELAQRSVPRVSGRVLVREPVPWGQFIVGHMIGVKSALYGLDANYQIYGLRLFVDNRAALQSSGLIRPQIACEMEFGRREADIVSTLRILARKDAALPEAVIGEDTVIPAENIVGVIDAEHIGGVAAENIQGQILADQIGTVAAETIIGVIGGPGSSATVSGQSITGVIGGPGSTVDVVATSITGVIVSDQLADQILDSQRLVSQEFQVIERIPASGSLPALPHVEYPVGSTVLWSAIYGVSRYGTARYGSTLYENVAGAWQVASASSTLTGTLRYSDIESIQAQQIIGLIVARQIQNIAAEQITGIIQGDQIGIINATSIISVNATAITGPISAANITALNAGDITMITKWDETRIQSVNASSLTAGTVTATVRFTSPDIEVSGSGYTLRLKTTTGLEITATGTTRQLTMTDAGVRVTGTSGYYAQLFEYGLSVVHPAGPNAAIGASPTQSTLSMGYGASSGFSITADVSGVFIVATGGSTSLNLGGIASSIHAGQYRHSTNAGAVTITGSAAQSVYAYNAAGAVIGRIPIFP